MRKIFIGAAWPYANGTLHFGHISALIGGDILARYFRSAGQDVLYVSGTDCHGTPIALEAEKKNMAPAALAEQYHQAFHKLLCDDFQFSYDLYTKTTTPNHYQVAQDFFLSLYKKGLARETEQEMAYCTKDARFLPDRYLEGTCPHCGYLEARGDQCDNCGRLLDPKDLKEPRCKICGTNSIIWKPTKHVFIELTKRRDELAKWAAGEKGWRRNAENATQKLLAEGLQDRSVTRDTAWGIPVPLPGYEDKVIYVWFEAVCGYYSASKQWAAEKGKPDAFKEWWQGPDSTHYYVHGKDNILFHTIIWPFILMGQDNLHLPDRIISSEYLNLESKQFSKSRRWSVDIHDALARFGVDNLRYYLVMNGPESADTNFAWDDFMAKVNGELAAKCGNFVNRTLTQIQRNFEDGVDLPAALNPAEQELIHFVQAAFGKVGTCVENGEFRSGLWEVIRVCEEGNRYLDKAAPWKAIKTSRDEAARILAVAAKTCHAIALLIEPFVPGFAGMVLGQLGLGKGPWAYPAEPTHYQAHDVKPLVKLVDEAAIKELKAALEGVA